MDDGDNDDEDDKLWIELTQKSQIRIAFWEINTQLAIRSILY